MRWRCGPKGLRHACWKLGRARRLGSAADPPLPRAVIGSLALAPLNSPPPLPPSAAQLSETCAKDLRDSFEGDSTSIGRLATEFFMTCDEVRAWKHWSADRESA